MANNKIPLNAQYFCRDIDNRRRQETTGEGPKLLYVGMTSASAGNCPRIMHAHPDLLEFMLITEGEADFFVNDRMHHVSSGDLLIYNAGVVHDEFPGKNTNISSCYIAVQNTCLQGTGSNTLAPQEKGCIYKTGEDFEDLHILLSMMYRTLTQGDNCAESVCKGLMHAFLEKAVHIVDEAPVLPEEPKTPARELGLQVQHYIDDHFTDSLSLPEIADALHISQFYLAHVFKEMSGYSPIQYMIRRRIGEAQTLLISTDKTILEISELVGYESQSHFNFHFSKNIGMPPNQFRRSFVLGRTARRRHTGRQPARASQQRIMEN